MFRSNYGQAGTLSIDLDKVKSQWAFFTIWEDHTEVAIEPQWKSHFHFWEEDKLTFFQPHLDLPAHLEKPLAIKAQIPEYYSIKAKLQGDLDFT